MEMADDDKLMTVASDEVDLPGEEMASDVDDNVDINTQRSKYDN
jgi:hypothetical protein